MFNDNELNPYLISSSTMTIHNNTEPGVMFQERIVRWYELELITDANQGYIINIDHRINAKKGLLMFRKPGSVVNGVSSYACHSIAFDCQYDPSLTDYYNQPMFENATVDSLKTMANKKFHFLETLPEAIQLSNYIGIKSLFEEMTDLSLKGLSGQSIKSKQLLFTLFDEITTELNLHQNAKHKNTHNSYDAIIRTKDWIDAHYHQPITLQALANKIGYSKEAYCRLFKKILNQTPIDYLISIRLINAKKRLMITNEPISLIAYECGFKNDTHFYTSFKQRVGLSPGNYRERHRRM